MWLHEGLLCRLYIPLIPIRLSVWLVLFVLACSVPVACSLFKSMRAINTTDVRIKLLYFISFYNGQQILAYNNYYNKSIIIIHLNRKRNQCYTHAMSSFCSDYVGYEHITVFMHCRRLRYLN